MIRTLMLGRRCYFDLIMISQKLCRADIWPMSEKMTFITSRQTVRKIYVGPTLLFRPDYDIAKLTSGRHRANVGKDGIHNKSANCQKTDVGPMLLFFYLNYDIGKLTSGRHLTDVWKDEIHDKSANDQIMDVGPTLLFRPDYDIAKLTSGRHRANVGKDGIHNKSANCQKTDVGPMFFGPELWYREIDVGPTSDRCLKRWNSWQVG